MRKRSWQLCPLTVSFEIQYVQYLRNVSLQEKSADADQLEADIEKLQADCS